MARPIRNTPIITGKDATAFIQAVSTIPSETIRRTERIRLENSVIRFKTMLAKLLK